jgi:outer membrane biosynthesis protein TonB
MSNLYKVGGALPLDAPSYIRRQADQDLYEGLLAGEFCYVLNSRQMGKSSLRVQTMRRLQEMEIDCAAIDITKIGSQGITPEEWYAGVLFTLINQLYLPLTLQEFEEWWEDHRLLSPVNRFTEFIDSVLLEEITGRIVIFIDEIDSILQLDFKDDFFAAIRACYNKRAENSDYNRLTFALLGVATPSNLIQDKNRTPFNIGRAIQLNGFQFEEARPLAQGLADIAANPEAALQAILNWTGGQPFLTQKICQLVLASSDSIPEGEEATQIEQLVRSRIIENWESQDEPEHLRTIRDRLLRSGEQRTGRLLGLYQQIVQHGEITTDDPLEQIELQLTGLVVRQDGKLRVYNCIYQQVFNQEWVKKVLDDLRPYAEAFNAWVASGYKDESRLLRGETLQKALTWAEGKSLGNRDYQFLANSQEFEKREFKQANQILTEAKRKADLALAEAQQKSELALEEERKAIEGLAEATETTQRLRRRARNSRIGAYVVGSIAFILLCNSIISIQEFRTEQEKTVQAIKTAEQAEKMADQAIKRADKAKKQETEAIQAKEQAEKAKRQAKERADQAQDQEKQAKNRLASTQASLVKTQAEVERNKLNAEMLEADKLLNSETPIKGLIYAIDAAYKSLSREGYKTEQEKAGNVLKNALDVARETAVFKVERPVEIIQSIQNSKSILAIQIGEYDWGIEVWEPQGRSPRILDKKQSFNITSSSTGKPAISTILMGEDLIVATGNREGILNLCNYSYDREPVYCKKLTLPKEIRERQIDITSVAISTNGQMVIAGANDGKIRVWRMEQTSEDPLITLNFPENSASVIESVSLNFDGSIIVGSNEDGIASLWFKENDGSYSEPSTLSSQSIGVVSISADGQMVVSGGGDGVVRILKREGIDDNIALTGHTERVNSVVLVDNETIISSSDDRTIRLWKLSPNGQEPRKVFLKGHSKSVSSIAVSPDKRVAVSSGKDNTVRFWDITMHLSNPELMKDPKNLIAYACNRLRNHPMLRKSQLEIKEIENNVKAICRL